jgi:hypothetical protein
MPPSAADLSMRRAGAFAFGGTMNRFTSYWRQRVAPSRIACAMLFSTLLFCALAAGAGAMPVGVVGATTATYVPTKTTDLNGLWRKIQGPLRIAANFMFPEWDELEDFSEFNVDWSTREITAPFDLVDDTGVASIREGGKEARPGSVNTVDGTFTWILLNARFSVTKTAKWIDQKNKAAMISSQIQYQGRKKLEAMGRRIKDYFWGFSTGVVAQVGSTITNNGTATVTFTVTNGYGQSSITNGAYLAQILKANEWIALVRSAALVTNAIGQITSATVSGGVLTVVVAFNGSVTAAASDSIVFANSLENTTLTDGTDYNLAMTGWLDALTSTSVQGISGSTYANWNPGYTNTASGRLTNIEIRKMKQGIDNNSPEGFQMDILRMSQGVENDLFDQMQAGLRFDDSFGLEVDGQPKTKGVDWKALRSVPPGFAVGRSKKALQKMVLLPKPGQPSWDDAEKIQDVSGYVFPIDYPCNMVWTCRGALAYQSNKAEQ